MPLVPRSSEDMESRGNPTQPREGVMTRSESTYERWGKRCLDVLLATVVMVLLSPVLALCALAVMLDSGKPILFRQERVGRRGTPFTLLKFRSMSNGLQGGPLVTSAKDSRVSRSGRWLRRTKLDELPQLINVLRGDMSLVGPRPEVPEYVVLYTQRQKAVLNCRPGITSPTSLDFIDEEEVLGKDDDPERLYRETVMPEKLETDLRYCCSVTLKKDVAVLFRTLFHICGRQNHSL